MWTCWLHGRSQADGSHHDWPRRVAGLVSTSLHDAQAFSSAGRHCRCASPHFDAVSEIPFGRSHAMEIPGWISAFERYASCAAKTGLMRLTLSDWCIRLFRVSLGTQRLVQVVFGFFGFCAALQAVGLYLVRYVPSSYQDRTHWMGDAAETEFASKDPCERRTDSQKPRLRNWSISAPWELSAPAA